MFIAKIPRKRGRERERHRESHVNCYILMLWLGFNSIGQSAVALFLFPHLIGLVPIFPSKLLVFSEDDIRPVQRMTHSQERPIF